MKTNFRKTIVVGTLIMISTTVSFGQFQFGAVTGSNFSTQSEFGNIWKNDGIYSNVNTGLLTRYSFNDWFALKSSVLYSRKGRTFDENNVDQTDKFSYLEVPVKAEFSTALGKQRFFAATGPYIGFLLDAKNEIGDLATDLNDQAKTTDFGVSMELGVEVPVSKHALQLSLNYDMGLTKIADYDDDLRNKTLSLNVGWLF